MASRLSMRGLTWSLALTFCTTLSAHVALAARSETSSSEPTVRSAIFTLDGVTLDVSGSFLPPARVYTSAPGSVSQVARTATLHPFRELTISAVPFGSRSGTEDLPVAQAAGAAVYQLALAEYRTQQGGAPQPGPVASIFGQQPVGLASVVNLDVNGPTPTPVVIVEWVVEAGPRIWIVRASQEQAAAAQGPQPSEAALASLDDLTLASDTLDNASTVRKATSAMSARPVGAGPETQGPVLNAAADLPAPYWWNGSDCDYDHYFTTSGVSSYRLGAVYRGMPACGPLNTVVQTSGFPTVPAGPQQLEWQCAELSKRYLYLAFGCPAYGANGSQVVDNYPASCAPLQKIPNGTVGAAPQPGDVLSYGSTSTAGHTSVVMSSNVDGSGNGSITVIEQNYSSGGQATHTVTNWNVNSSLGVTKWLHSPTSSGTLHVVGDWNGDGVPKMWTFSDGTWMIPADDNGGVVKTFGFGAINGAIPVVGDWDGDGIVNYGVFVPNDVDAGLSTFYLDVDRVGGYDWAVPLAGLYPADLPVVGDWDGDGWDDIGAYNPLNGTFYLALIDHGTHLRQDLTPFVFQGWQPDDLPIAGKWAGGSTDDVGLFRAKSPNPYTNDFIVRQADSYYDLAAQTGDGYGDSVDTPLIADWDQSGYDSIGVSHRADNQAHWRVPLWPKLNSATPPPTPLNFRVTATTTTTVSLAWDDVSGEDGYRIYKWDGGGFPLYAQLGSNVTSYTDAGLSCNSQYFYEVSAYNASGESGYAGWIMATTQPCGGGPPPTPSNFQVTGTTTTTASLAWDDVSGEDGYRIYKWDGSGFPLYTQLGANVVSYTDSGLNCDSPYFYEVGAYNAAGESAPTAWITATTQPCVGGDVELSNAVPYPDSMTAASQQGTWRYYYVDVPAGATQLAVNLDQLTADVDLYVRPVAKPDLNTYDCRPFEGGTTSETCTFSDPAAGRWWIGVNNWATGTIGYRVTATFSSGQFFTVAPCRVLDTRNPVGPYGGPALVAGTDRVFTIAGQCGIPSTATAVSVNVAVTQGSAAGNLRLFRAGTTLPLVSSINYSAGQTRSNNAIVGLNGQGQVAVRCSQASGTAHFILDVNGYFE